MRFERTVIKEESRTTLLVNEYVQEARPEECLEKQVLSEFPRV